MAPVEAFMSKLIYKASDNSGYLANTPALVFAALGLGLLPLPKVALLISALRQGRCELKMSHEY